MRCWRGSCKEQRIRIGGRGVRLVAALLAEKVDLGIAVTRFTFIR